ncbi:MAG: SDR family oxidoreductase [Acidobacteriota bacterium]
MQIKDRHVVVTGGASGIGKALCERFAADGARGVVVADLQEDAAHQVANAVGGLAVACDVGQKEQVEELVHKSEEAFGPIDLFCSNAGIATGSDVLDDDLDVWQMQWDVNLMAHVHAVKAVLPGMLERGEGYLLHTASMAGILSTHLNVPYAVTKHAVVGLAEWLAFTYKHRGIGVSCLAPLGVRTPMLGDTDSDWAKNAAGDVKEPEDVATMVTEALAEERFLITTDDIAQQWMEGKTADPDRWIAGMNRLQQKLEGS